MTEFQKSVLAIRCPECGRSSSLGLQNWCCDHCAAPWLPFTEKRLDPGQILTSSNDVWRYVHWMGMVVDVPVQLGAGGTPLVFTKYKNRSIFVKVEYQNPTGSFKDRGVEVMVSALGQLGARQVVEDSSGNAGASVSAYAARAGMQSEVYAPETASRVKLGQIEMYGARVKRIPGPRLNSTQAVMQAVQEGAVFASHAWNPAYLLGQQTAAWEVWEQLDHRVPDWWVTPAGQGGHLLGIWMGFQRLFKSGLIDHLPRMAVVQSARIAPLALAIQNHKTQIEPVQSAAKTMAEGVVVSNPVRWRQILGEARDNQWLGFSIPEEEILPARQELAHQGFFVEPTSALAAAALPGLFPQTRAEDLIVVSLTGSGLKVPII
jgi:threonine synthase